MTYNQVTYAKIRCLLIVGLVFVLCTDVDAQLSRMVENVQYQVSMQGTAGGGDNAPFWFTNNRYGLGTSDNFGGVARVSLFRNVETDSLWFWRMGYGVELASPINSENGYFCVQQA